MGCGCKGSHIDQTLSAIEKALERKANDVKDFREHIATAQHNAQPHFDMEGMMKQGQDAVKSFWEGSMKELEEKPWHFLGKIAAGSFAVGLVLSARHKHSQSKDQS